MRKSKRRAICKMKRRARRLAFDDYNDALRTLLSELTQEADRKLIEAICHEAITGNNIHAYLYKPKHEDRGNPVTRVYVGDL